MPLLVGLKSSIAWRAHAIDTAPEFALYGPDTSVRCPILSAVAARAEPITEGAASAVHAPVAPTNSSRRDRLFGLIIQQSSQRVRCRATSVFRRSSANSAACF